MPNPEAKRVEVHACLAQGKRAAIPICSARERYHDGKGESEFALLRQGSLIVQCKNRFDAAAEELERLLVSKEGESFKDAGMRNAVGNSGSSASGSSLGNGSGGGGGKRALGKAMKTGGMLFKGKGAGSIQKQEDDIRSRLGTANDAFRKSVQDFQTLRQEYFNFQLPKILRVSLSIEPRAQTWLIKPATKRGGR